MFYLTLKGRVQSANGFLFIFWARNFIFGIHMYFWSNKKKMQKKNFFGQNRRPFWKISVKTPRARARADGSITRSILLWFLRFLEWCFMIVLSQMYFFIFLIKWKLTISGYILKWRDYFSLFWTFFDFQRHLKSPIYFFPKNKKIHLR